MRKITITLFCILALLVVGCTTAPSVYEDDYVYFEYPDNVEISVHREYLTNVIEFLVWNDALNAYSEIQFTFSYPFYLGSGDSREQEYGDYDGLKAYIESNEYGIITFEALEFDGVDAFKYTEPGIGLPTTSLYVPFYEGDDQSGTSVYKLYSHPLEEELSQEALDLFIETLKIYQ